MRIINFAKRNFKEIIRDPLSIIFAILLPLFLLFIFQQFNILGLSFSINIISAILVSIVIAILFIAIGILIGSTFTEKASSGVSSIVVQLVCFTGEMYFPKEMLGNAFAKICNILPFESCVTIIKGIMNNNIQIISLRNIIVFLTYTIAILAISIIVFKRKMISDNK